MKCSQKQNLYFYHDGSLYNFYEKSDLGPICTILIISDIQKRIVPLHRGGLHSDVLFLNCLLDKGPSFTDYLDSPQKIPNIY